MNEILQPSPDSKSHPQEDEQAQTVQTVSEMQDHVAASCDSVMSRKDRTGETPLLMTARTLARKLAISTRTIWRLRNLGQIPAPIRLGGQVRWRVTEIEKWITDHCPDTQSGETTSDEHDEEESATHPTSQEWELADLQFSPDVLSQLTEISQQHQLPREKRKLAVLAALLETTVPQTPEMLSQKTGYAVRQIVPIIGSLKNAWLSGSGWEIKGKSTTGWTMCRK